MPMRILSARYAKRIKRLGWTDSLSDWFMLDPRYFVEMTPSGGFQVVPLKEEQTYTKALDEAKRNPIVPGINPLKD